MKGKPARKKPKATSRKPNTKGKPRGKTRSAKQKGDGVNSPTSANVIPVTEMAAAPSPSAQPSEYDKLAKDLRFSFAAVLRTADHLQAKTILSLVENVLEKRPADPSFKILRLLAENTLHKATSATQPGGRFAAAYAKDDLRSPSAFAKAEDERRPKRAGQIHGELKPCVAKLNGWFRELSARAPGPCAVDLTKMDSLVEELALLVRKRLPADLWDCYRAVDRAYHGLKLRKTVEELVERAVKGVAQRPMASIREKGIAKDKLGKLAARFPELVWQLERDPSSVRAGNWQAFAPLLRWYQNPTAPSSDDTPLKARVAQDVTNVEGLNSYKELTAYTVCLEILAKDRVWCRDYEAAISQLYAWLWGGLGNHKLGLRLQRIVFGDFGEEYAKSWQRKLDERSAKRCRKAALERQKKFRAKRKCQKS